MILVINLNLTIDKTVIVPALRKGRIHRFASVLTLPGGKGVNVARALKTLGVPCRNSTIGAPGAASSASCRIMGFTAGLNGKWIERALVEEGFEAKCVFFSPGESRICLSVVDARDNSSTDFNEEGSPISNAASAEFMKEYAAALKRCQVVCFSGRIGRGLQDDYYARLIFAARRRGVPSVLDTSGGPLVVGAGAGPTILKLNDEEFFQVAGRPAGKAAVLNLHKKLARKGNKIVIVTRGSKPGYAVAAPDVGVEAPGPAMGGPAGNRFWTFFPPKVKLVTPVGAGDSFLAGFIRCYVQGRPMEEALRWSLAAAGSDCLSLGAGFVKMGEIKKILPRVRVKGVVWR